MKLLYGLPALFANHVFPAAPSPTLPWVGALSNYIPARPDAAGYTDTDTAERDCFLAIFLSRRRVGVDIFLSSLLLVSPYHVASASYHWNIPRLPSVTGYKCPLAYLLLDSLYV